jgi:hypothetical protein
MSTAKALGAQVEDHQRLCRQRLKSALLLSVAGVLLAIALFNYGDRIITLGGYALQYKYLVLAVMMPLVIACVIEWLGYARLKKLLSEYSEVQTSLGRALHVEDRELVQRAITAAQQIARHNALARIVIAQQQPALCSHIEKLSKANLNQQLEIDRHAFKLECDDEIECLKAQVPLIKAKEQIRSSLELIQRRRKEISKQWESAYEQFSWWNKLWYSGTTPDFTAMDKITRELQRMESVLLKKHSADLNYLDTHFAALKADAFARVATAASEAHKFIAECGGQNAIDSDLLKKALWFSALSVPVSLWADFDRAGNVYDALRGVNNNFAGMSDSEIWWETLFLSENSLTGLAALTKGAYFEQLVAADTGGVLFEHFNHPNTDMVLDSVAYQLKATDSASYVNSVDDEIPVIATSEVALQTDAIDSGFCNTELTHAVDLALGDTVIDIGDTAVDAILSGVGGLGFFATVEGINHAAAMHANGGDAVEAMFEGFGVAVKGTARTFVDTAEMGYKVLASRPSRFVGRSVLKGLKKLDEKITAEAARK